MSPFHIRELEEIWGKLDSERQMGFCAGRIPYSKVREIAREYLIDIEYLWYVIVKADVYYLEKLNNAK